MTLMDWSSNFSVGVQAMDQQHQKWFSLLNRLHDAMRDGRGMQLQGAILSDMIDYTQSHFRREEEFLGSSFYPELPQHAEKHRAFARHLLEMESKVKTGEPVLTFDLMDSLKLWLEQHILKEDKKYGEFLASRTRK